MSCDNVITVQDLETDKKHSTFYREVITGKAGGTGADIDLATNAITGQVQKTLPKILDDLDWSYVGLFADGVTFTDKTDFAVDADGVQWIYTGSLPFSATAGTVPSEPTYQAVHVKSASAISNANGGSVQDFIDAQTFANIEDMKAFDNLIVGQKVVVYENDNVSNYKIVASNGDVILDNGLHAKLLDVTTNNINLNTVKFVFAGMSTAANGAGNVSGLVEYDVTFYTSTGETGRVGLSNPITVSNNSVLVTQIPTSDDPRVIGRRLYRNVQSATDVVLKQLVVDIADNTTTQYNDNIADVALGARLPWNNTTGGMIDINGERHFISNDNCLFIGSKASVNNTNYANVAVGPDSLRVSETAIRCTAVGVLSLPSLINGTSNGAFGVHAGQSLINGSNNNFFGYSTGFNLEYGSDNTIIGDQAGRSMGLGTGGADQSKHTVVGSRAMHEFVGSPTPNRPNTAYGYRALYANEFGVGNLMLGSYAGQYGDWNDTIILDTIDRGNNAGILDNSPLILKMGSTPSDQSLKLNARLRSANTNFYNGVSATDDGCEMNQLGEWNFSRVSTDVVNSHVFFNGGNVVGVISQSGGNTCSFTNLSDESYKENINPALSATELTKKIEIVSFDWKSGGEHVNYGVIAQRLHKTNPEAVVVGCGDIPWSVDNSKLIPQLIKTIQELEARLSALELAK